MSRRPRALALAATALACAVSAVPAATASAQTKKVAVIKLNSGATGFTPSDQFVTALTTLGIGPAPITGAKLDDDGVFVFNVTSGSLAGNQPEKGLIRHNGGLRLLQGQSGIKVDLNNLRLNDGDPAFLTTQIDSGDRLALAKLSFKKAKVAASKTKLGLLGVRATLTAPAAAALNATFKTTAFTAGLPIGQLDFVARYRVKIKPKR